MRSVNIREAKPHLTRPVQDAAQGKMFIIAKAGKPMVKVIPYSDDEEAAVQRLGFLSGEIAVPEDFDQMGAEDLAALFDGEDS